MVSLKLMFCVFLKRFEYQPLRPFSNLVEKKIGSTSVLDVWTFNEFGRLDCHMKIQVKGLSYFEVSSESAMHEPKYLNSCTLFTDELSRQFSSDSVGEVVMNLFLLSL